MSGIKMNLNIEKPTIPPAAAAITVADTKSQENLDVRSAAR
jgi:hypothetical protein